MRSKDPARAAVERWWLLFTPVWAAIVGGLMVSGVVEKWGDVPCLILGLSLALGAMLPPILRPHAEDKARAFCDRRSVQCAFAVVLLSFGANYSQTAFFFDVLHMHYGFHTAWTIQNNPIFLYFLTIAYFATYFVLCSMSLRYLLAHTKGGWRALAWIVAPLAIALMESLLNANPFCRSLFCYDDLRFVLWFGTVAYGIGFMLALPGWMAIGDRANQRIPMVQVALWTLAALYADRLVLDVLRYNVAPHFTVVGNGAASCLVSL